MANLKSFDTNGIHEKMNESATFLHHFDGQERFETDTEEYEFIDAITTGISGAIELVQRGEATEEQEVALYTYLEKYGLL